MYTHTHTPALKMGDLESANSYIQCIDPSGNNAQSILDDKILRLQIAAKSGLAEETRKVCVCVCVSYTYINTYLPSLMHTILHTYMHACMPK